MSLYSDIPYGVRVAGDGAEIRSSFVHAQLRKDVLQGALPPGSRLRVAQLAERFSVSRSVMREALTRLTEQGLAVATPQQGFRVHPLSVSDLRELTDARLEVEPLVLRRAIEHGDIGWESATSQVNNREHRTTIDTSN